MDDCCLHEGGSDRFQCIIEALDNLLSIMQASLSIRTRKHDTPVAIGFTLSVECDETLVAGGNEQSIDTGTEVVVHRDFNKVGRRVEVMR